MIEDNIADILEKYPDMSKGFRPMEKWENIVKDKYDEEARKIFIDGDEQNLRDNEHIRKERSISHIISYIRYDYKKTIIRTREFYIDKYLNSNNLLDSEKISEISFGFFEPLILCFSFADGLSFIKYGNNKLIELLNDVGNGYRLYSKHLYELFRNGITHCFVPYGFFEIDLNTENNYKGPIFKTEILKLYINIPHFIDSLVIELERLIGLYKGKESGEYIDNYIKCLNVYNKNLGGKLSNIFFPKKKIKFNCF